MVNPKFIENNAKVRKQVAELKIWLADKEILEYNAWKKSNEKDRTAMDKVVAVLKADDDEWVQKEDELRMSEILLTTQNMTLEILKKMISSVTYEAITREEFDAYQDQMSKWFKED